MRITAEAKTATRSRILEIAARLFQKDGWDGTTTRSIAVDAGIATGTLFNYFPSKEQIAAALLEEELECAREDFLRHRSPDNTLEEDLFSLIWTGLKGLRKYRAFAGPAMETVFSPLARPTAGAPGDAIRVAHLELVERIVVGHGIAAPLPPVTIQLYWTLYLGVAAFWAADHSPHQEDTLALLDQSLKLLAASLRNRPAMHKEKEDERESE